MDEEQRSPFGAILMFVGIIGLAFILVARYFELRGPILDFLSEYIIVPIGLIFAGRRMISRARKSNPPPAEIPAPRRQQRHQGGAPTSIEDMMRAAEKDRLAAEEERSAEVERMAAQARRTQAPRTKTASQPQVPAPAPAPAPIYAPPHADFKPKTSEEMIAEAKKRLARKN